MGKTEKEVRLKIYELIKITESKKKEKEMSEKEAIENIFMKFDKVPAIDSRKLSKLEVLDICDV